MVKRSLNIVITDSDTQYISNADVTVTPYGRYYFQSSEGFILLRSVTKQTNDFGSVTFQLYPSGELGDLVYMVELPDIGKFFFDMPDWDANLHDLELRSEPYDHPF